jgi:RIO-like serine/threonine protein kinase
LRHFVVSPVLPLQVTGLGRKIGVGKESDVYVGQGPGGEEVVLKFARLGRTSFRSIKRNRDYLQHRKVKTEKRRGALFWGGGYTQRRPQR